MDYTEEELAKKNLVEKFLIKQFKKLVFALALLGAVTGSISIIISSVSDHKSNKLNYYLDRDGRAIWGDSVIWFNKWEWNTASYFSLYFGWKKTHIEDLKWDGIYPENYFEK